MARKPNEQVVEKLLQAAEEVFAEAGYKGATVAGIARRAEVSTGNVYRYFKDKDALFHSVITDEFATRFLALLYKRVESLISAPQLTDLPPDAHDNAKGLLQFWVDNRLKVITILDRAQGSRHETFVDKFIDELMQPTLVWLNAANGGTAPDDRTRFLLEQIFRNTVRVIVAILESSRDEEQVRRAFQGFWSYQLAGLAGFSQWVVEHGQEVDGT